MCGIFGMFSPGPVDAAGLTYLGLYSLQHRGQESAGMVVSDGERMRLHKAMGLVGNVFDEPVLEGMPGRISIGHVRYSTTGAPHVANAQPLLAFSRHGQLALAHNGNLTNTNLLRQELLSSGSAFQTTTDSEVILNLIAAGAKGEGLEEAVERTVRRIAGGYAIVLMTNDALIGIRDPLGIRPLSIGRRGDEWFFASESCAFDIVGAELVRDLLPGEIAIIDEEGIRSHRFAAATDEAFCVFEFIYFARPDSVIDGKSVHEVRKAIGRKLAQQRRVEADLVIPAPDSAMSAALGYAEQAGIPFDIGLAKNRYVGRTFIQPTPTMRRMGVRIKLNPIAETVRNKRVVLVDDSIVRGTTSQKTIQLLREAKAAEVHMAVASPPFSHPCYYGIDVPTSGELIAHHRSVDDVCRLIGADSLDYLSFASLYEAIGVSGNRLCAACFGGGFPTKIEPGRFDVPDLLEDRRRSIHR